MKLTTKYTIVFLTLIAALGAFAQKKGENIGTEVVNMVKPYTPTISDAFKVKETPAIEDEDNTAKENVIYNIFSFPVASTFTPSKGKAANVDRTKQAQLYKNFATFGVGNYGTINAELFVTEEVGDNSYVAGMFRNLSSQGGIKDLWLDDKYNNTSLDLTFGSKGDIAYTIDLGYQNQGYNWYGLPKDFGEMLVTEDRNQIINSIDSQQSYHNLSVGSNVIFNESIFNNVSLKYNRFWDAYGSQENRFFVKPNFVFEINDTKIKTEVIADYLGGTFERGYQFADKITYGYANFGIRPSFNMVRNDWSIDFGAAVFYSMDLEDSDGKIFIYPAINASLKVVGDLMVFYAGAEGTLQQNSYRDFTNENPFVSPTLNVGPTDRQYDIFAGLKGKLASSVSYNLRASYTNERAKAMFRSNPYTLNPDNKDYAFGNSFGVVYDDVKTISGFGEIKADFSKNIAFGISATFNSYSVDNQDQAWNLPVFNVATSLDVNITEKWYAGLDVFAVGERKDLRDDSIINGSESFVTLDSYFDANAHIGYKYNERLTGFLKFNNIGNQSYQKWLDYQVQGFQVVIGASYKFDF